MNAYLFLGADRAQKDAKISELKKRYLSSRESYEFDYELLYGHKLDSDTLKKALLAIPTVIEQRLILIRECDKLSPHNREILLEFLRQKIDNVVLLLESDTLQPSDQFVGMLKSYVKVVDFQNAPVKNVFDMTRAIGMKKSTEALAVLFQLLSSGVHPLQIMGGIIWFWGRSKDRIPPARFQQGLVAMQEADFNIKRSRLRPEYAVELLVVKLCALV